MSRPKAVLVGLQLPSVPEHEVLESLAELGRLVKTLGFEVVAQVTQKRSHPEAGTVIGEGKLKELARLTGGSGIVHRFGDEEEEEGEASEPEVDEEDLGSGEVLVKAEKVIFDDDLSPSQLRNLESATGVDVLDRSGVIIEIFHRHARTREARLQVDIARLRYLAPRLKLARMGQDRQGGGIGAKGVGETSHELDKRRIRDRIAELKRELETIRVSQDEQRQGRRDQAKVALVGYTNAGKSSLMRALTGSEVLVEDKLFATLGTTVRALQPETLPRVLISDTVGFIKKLPHDLVASFRSTLDEAKDAGLLLYVVDASDPTFRSQLEVTRSVLAELDLAATESVVVLNKVDKLTADEISVLREEFPQGFFMSALQGDDVASLRERIIAHFEHDMIEAELRVPYAEGHLIGVIRSSLRVIGESHDDDSTTLRVRGYEGSIEAIKKKMAP
jgi:GTP-binding protein HflX